MKLTPQRMKFLHSTDRVHYSFDFLESTGGGAFHQAFCQCVSLTNLLSANQMQGFQ